MICHFNLTPGGLKEKQYCDNKYRIFEVKNVWSGNIGGGVQQIDLLELDANIIHKLKIDVFKEFLVNKQLVQI